MITSAGWLNAPWKIAAIYLLAGFAWILFSDHALLEIFQGRALIMRLMIFKGWVFVLASAALILF